MPAGEHIGDLQQQAAVALLGLAEPRRERRPQLLRVEGVQHARDEPALGELAVVVLRGDRRLLDSGDELVDQAGGVGARSA